MTLRAMHIRDFQNLSLESKIQWLFFEGEFIMDIRYYEFKINLYLIKNYYIEVFFNHKEACIERIELLDHQSKRMKFYADQVKLKMA